MADTYVYYALVSERYTRDEPFAVIRRKPFPTGGGYDEGIGRGTDWKHTPLLIDAEQGNNEYEFVEIDEAEVSRLVEYYRAWRKAYQQRQAQQQTTDSAANDADEP